MNDTEILIKLLDRIYDALLSNDKNAEQQLAMIEIAYTVADKERQKQWIENMNNEVNG